MDNLKVKTEALLYFKQFKRYSDVLTLIGLIKGLMFKVEYQNNISDTLYMGSK